jgi:hypothetical protein
MSKLRGARLDLTYTLLDYSMSIFSTTLTLSETVTSWKNNTFEFPGRIEIIEVRLVP